MDASIQGKDLEHFRQLFDAEPAYTVAMNAVTANGVDASAKNFGAKAKYQHSFNVEVESGKACNQKQSGRCWMFASLNVMRLDVMEKLNLENMELSQNYPLFYDKLEKSNYFLENMLKTLDEPVGSRLLHFLLLDPLGDGGQWDMFRSLVAKYGVVPKEVMPETAASSATRELRDYMTKKLREYACRLREAYRSGAGMDELRTMKDDMMAVIYRMLVIALGKPPVRFSWGTRDKDKNFVEVKDITPQEFFEKYVGWNLDEYVTVINAPTADKPFGKTFTVQYLGNGKALAYSGDNAVGSSIGDVAYYYSIIDVNSKSSTRLAYNGTEIPYSSGSFSQRSVYNANEKKAYIGVNTADEQCIYIYDVATSTVTKGASIAAGYYFDQIRLFQD